MSDLEGRITATLLRLKNHQDDEMSNKTIALQEACETLIRDMHVAMDNQETRIADLEEALAPLDALADAVFVKYETSPGVYRETYSSKSDDTNFWSFNGTAMTYGDLRRARAALTKAKGGSEEVDIDSLTGTADDQGNFLHE